MTAAQLSDALHALGWSGRTLARLLGYSPGAIAEWTSGRNRVPAEIAAWLRAELAWRTAHPPPPRNGSRPDHD
jgi:transcriptional regulator with XRE-family HTH domain